MNYLFSFGDHLEILDPPEYRKKWRIALKNC